MNYKFQESKKTSTKKIVEKIREFGIVFLPNFLEGNELKQMTKEAEEIINKTTENFKKYSHGKVARLHHPPFRQWPRLSSFYTQRWMYEIADEWFGNNHYNLNEEVFIGYDYREDNKNLPPNAYIHADKTQTFKYFIYLSDVDINCGPFCCIPGSHNYGKTMVENAWKKTHQYGKVKNKIKDYPNCPYSEKDAIPILGKAGDMMVFTTNTLHAGSNVKQGYSRLLARGHTRRK